jgi:hypothetical protein
MAPRRASQQLVCWRLWLAGWYLAEHLSEPQIMVRGRSNTSETIIIDDFREAYWWLRDNTPEDARVMAWWDYGYQINGVGNVSGVSRSVLAWRVCILAKWRLPVRGSFRASEHPRTHACARAQRTTIADGNTWNHEHIALLGKCLTSRENISHPITRHLADYVLIWTTRHAGMYADDLAKSPHMARIGASVYGDRIGCDVCRRPPRRDALIIHPTHHLMCARVAVRLTRRVVCAWTVAVERVLHVARRHSL